MFKCLHMAIGPLNLLLRHHRAREGEGEGLKGGGGGGGTVKATPPPPPPPPPPPLLCSIHSLPHPPPNQTLLMPYRWGAAAQIPNQQPEP